MQWGNVKQNWGSRESNKSTKESEFICRTRRMEKVRAEWLRNTRTLSLQPDKYVPAPYIRNKLNENCQLCYVHEPLLTAGRYSLLYGDYFTLQTASHFPSARVYRQKPSTPSMCNEHRGMKTTATTEMNKISSWTQLIKLWKQIRGGSTIRHLLSVSPTQNVRIQEYPYRVEVTRA